MKRKIKKRLLKILVPAEDNLPELALYITLDALKATLKEAIKTKSKAIRFNFNGRKYDLPISTARKAILSAENQIKAQNMIPDKLKPYLYVLAARTSEKLSARDEEIEKVLTCLCSEDKSNALLIGEHGVGKTTMAIEIARQINLRECPNQLAKYVVIAINLSAIIDLAEKNSKFMYTNVLNNLIDFVKLNSQKVIFYIDNFTYIKSNIELLKAFMLFIKSNIKFIASLTTTSFEKYFFPDEAIMKYLNPILLEEPEMDELYPMLKTRIEVLQKKYGVAISEKMIRFAILTGSFLSASNNANPEKTIDTINFALADARRKGKKEVSKSNILCYSYIDFKLAKKANENERIITAYHEAGHYLVSKMSKNIKCAKNAFVSILPIEGALGITASYWDAGQQLTFSKEYYLDEIAVCLGGRLGEEFYTHSYSSGAENDLIQANSMAEKLVLSYGLSDIDGADQKNYAIGNYIKDYLLTDEIKIKINKKISEILSDAYSRAKKIIYENQKLLKAIVEQLLKDNILIGDELEEIVSNFSIS